MKRFKDQYGEDGESVYYATANKQKRDPDTFHKEDIGTQARPEAVGFLKTLVNIWTMGWGNYIEFALPDATTSPQSMIDDYLKTGPQGMASSLLDSHAEDLKMNNDGVSQETGLHVSEMHRIITPMIKMKMDKIMASIIPENKYVLKQDIFMEHNGQMITIPKGTVIKEFAMGTGAIAMGQGGSFNVGSHPKGGAVAMDKPEKSSIGKKKKKKNKEVDEASNSQISPLNKK